MTPPVHAFLERGMEPNARNEHPAKDSELRGPWDDEILSSQCLKDPFHSQLNYSDVQLEEAFNDVMLDSPLRESASFDFERDLAAWS